MIIEIEFISMRTTTERKGGETEKSASTGGEKYNMSYKTYESDEDGRLIIYPALYPPREKGIFNLFKKLVKLISPFSEKVKGRLGNRGYPIGRDSE